MIMMTMTMTTMMSCVCRLNNDFGKYYTIVTTRLLVNN
jgi:hypothetical protein